MTHIMLDVETLDVTPTAVVTSIGAVVFDPDTGQLGDTFYIELTGDLVTQQRHGRTIDADTVCWWMQQSTMARLQFQKTPADGVERAGTVESLARFSRFVAAHGGSEAQIWGNGADFDNVVLHSLYKDMNFVPPWSFSKNRCYRTMRSLVSKDVVPSKPYGVSHNALDDAIAQANTLMDIKVWLRKQ